MAKENLSIVRRAAAAVTLAAGSVLNRVTSFLGPNRNGVVFLNRDRIQGVFLTEYEALRLSAVWACISAIAKTIASSDFHIFNEDDNGDRTMLPGSRTHYLLNVRPNPEMTPISFMECMMVQALTWGKSFAEIEYDAVGRPANLWPLDPDRSELVRGFKTEDQNGLIGFRYDDARGELFVRVTNINLPYSFLPYSEVLHFHGLSVDGICGLNMVNVAARPLLMMLASEKFRLAFYQHGTSLGGVLSTEQPLEQEKLDELKASVKDRVSGVENAFQFLVLGSGMTWQSLSQDFDKQQFLEMNQFMIEEICRYWDVPPHIIQHLLRATFNNIEHLGIQFVRSLRRWRKAVCQEIDFKILPPGPLGVDLDLAWAAEGDAKSIAETLGILADHGFIKRNEGRRKLGYNSIGKEGDTLTIQSAMTTLDRVNNGENLKKAATGAGTQDNPGAPAPKQPKRAPAAARAMIVAALRRSLQRQFVRVQNRKFNNRAKFEKWVLDTVQTDTNYTNEQFNDALTILEEIGITIVSRRAGVVEELCFESGRLLLKAFDEGKLPTWANDIEARAEAAVDALELKVEERGDEQ